VVAVIGSNAIEPRCRAPVHEPNDQSQPYAVGIRALGGRQSVMATLSHYIITRFNPRVSASSNRGLDPAWLRPRLKVFADLCAPSITRQSLKDFSWLVLFDDRTASDVRAEISILAERHRFEPVFLTREFAWWDLAEMLRFRTRRDGRIITSRLDNDDALHPEYVEWTQQYFASRSAGLLTFPQGCQLAQGEFYARPYLGNPFLSRVEPAQVAQTVYALKHWQHKENGAARIWTRDAAWLQVLHEQNLANEVRGVWRCPSKPTEIFQVPMEYLSMEVRGPIQRTRLRIRSVSQLVRRE